MNTNGKPVAVVIGATSKWQSDGRNTRLVHGGEIDDSDLPVGVRWGGGGAISLKFAREGFFTVLTTRNSANAAPLEAAIRERGDIEISSTGDLTFKNVPDFDRPPDSGGDNSYNVMVWAFDGSLTGTLDVTVMVTNVNEKPSVSTGKADITVPENTTSILARYSSTGPDKDDRVAWGVSGNGASAVRIDSSGNLAFDGSPDYENPGNTGGNNVYEVNVEAKDPNDVNLTSPFDVTVTVTPIDEPPVISGTTTFPNWRENDDNAVHTFSAADPEGDINITWTLGGTDSGDFDIVGGVLTFKNAPDYERPADSGGNNHYEITIQATDSNSLRGELHVDVVVQNVDVPPVITGSDAVDFPENSATSREVGRYTATDPEGATVTLSLFSGGDDFNLASNGVVTFEESPNFEDRSSYTFTVRVVAGSHTVNKPVTVNIQNVEEPGTVTLSSVQPQKNIPLSAALEDDDSPTGTTWQWYRTSRRGGTGTAITGATSSSYTPVHPEDTGSYLRVVAS